MEDSTQTERMMDGTLLILGSYLFIMPELRKNNPHQQRMAIPIGHKDRPATVAGKGRKIGQKGGVSLRGKQRRTGEDALAGHWEPGGVRLEALREGQDE